MEHHLKAARIIIVDDEVPNIKLIVKILKSEGYTNLVPIQDSRNLLDEYHRERTNLVLLDLRMPHLSGFEALGLLKGLEDPLMPPIVVLTADRGRESLIRAFDLGARDFLTKPFEIDELLARVRNMLEVNLAQLLLYAQRETLDSMVRDRTAELLRTRLLVIEKLGRASEYRDNETGQHIIRVGRTAALLSRRAGMDERFCEDILHAAPMHDIGKLGISDAILLKPGKLDPGEFEIMKGHTTIGSMLLEEKNSFDVLSLAQEVAATHHEKWDGTGYPAGLAGEDIPISGRIVELADVFDALTSERPYKKAWTVEAALDMIKENRGRHFDPALVDIFTEIVPEMVAIREELPDLD